LFCISRFAPEEINHKLRRKEGGIEVKRRDFNIVRSLWVNDVLDAVIKVVPSFDQEYF
jgi:hypothetical protein